MDYPFDRDYVLLKRTQNGWYVQVVNRDSGMQSYVVEGDNVKTPFCTDNGFGCTDWWQVSVGREDR